MNEFTGINPTEKIEDKTEKLPPLPFTYERTEDEEEAQFTIEVPDINGDNSWFAKNRKEKSQWYYAPEWRKKGLPQEQIELTVEGKGQITIYNFNHETQLTDEHLKITEEVLAEMVSRFPETINRLRYILINDKRGDPVWVGEDEADCSAITHIHQQTVEFYSKGMDIENPYPNSSAGRFKSVLIHEITHLIQKKFRKDWDEKFSWITLRNSSDWETQSGPNGETIYVHKVTGEKVVNKMYFPNEPEQCVSKYAETDIGEDICESMVAYLNSPERLRKISPDKYDILARYDASLPRPEINAQRVANEEISLPEIKPELVKYYVEKSQTERLKIVL